MKNYVVSVKQIENMKHCIGFSESRVKGKKNRKYDAWRNYFTTGGPDKDWDNLVEQGLAFREVFPHGGGSDPKLYYVSLDGFEFLGKILSAEITEIN